MAKGKDKKSKSSEQKARVQQKQAKKQAKGDKRVKSKTSAQDADSDADDNVDLDAVLAAYADEQARFLKVTEEPCIPPSPRSSSTIVASPSNRNELFIFGGEYMDSASVCHFYNDLYVYNLSKGEFSIITSPNSPPPRSGHACCRSGNSAKIYMSFGEFSSPKQGVFYHFNSMYMLDPDTREWTAIEVKGKGKSPPARSGHRMTYWKNYLIVFGGFQDTSQQTKYLSDTWVFDCKENVWHEMKLPPASQKPDPRSSFSLLPHESGAVLFGGYSRVKTTTNVNKQAKGGAQRNVLKPFVHQDTWFLRLTQPLENAPAGTPPGMRWERRKRPANSPNPARAGATMTYHKGRGIMVGGVHDVEASEEGIDSEFFNEMFIWNIDRNRFFPMTLRRPKSGAKRTAPVRSKNRGKADEEELLRNLAALETKGSIADAGDLEMQNAEVPEDEQETRKEVPVKFELPHPRFNAQLTLQEDTLYIFGGTFEKKDVEITFSDLYSIDLLKLDGVRELHFAEPPNWNAVTQDSDDEEDEDEDEDMDSAEEDEDDEADDMSVDAPSTPATDLSRATTLQVDEVEVEKTAQQDSRPFPRPFESLRDFFARTSEDWQKILVSSKGIAITSEQSVKELRKSAFSEAEVRWWDSREEVMALEDEQEAAGISEVVNIADRGAEGGAGRRR